MILFISAQHCGGRPAWGLPTLPNCLFNLGHILSLTQKFNYQNYSSRLLRSPGLCLRGQTCLPLATDEAFLTHSVGGRWAGCGHVGRPRILSWPSGGPSRTWPPFPHLQMMMQKGKDREWLTIRPRHWPNQWGLLVRVSQRRLCPGVAAHAGVTLDTSFFLTLHIPSMIMATLSTFSPLTSITILVQVTIISHLDHLLASQLDSPHPALPSPNVPISQLEGFFKMQS